MQPEVVISAQALRHNVRVLLGKTGLSIQANLVPHRVTPASRQRHMAIFPVLKADAYGHGAHVVGRVLEREFARSTIPMFCVARCGEARELRGEVRRPLVVLSEFDHSDFDELPRHTMLTLNGPEDIAKLRRVKSRLLRRAAGFHLNFNSGMNRLGFRERDLGGADFRWFLNQELPLVGVMSHLACAEEKNQNESIRQEKEFGRLIESLSVVVPRPRWIHISNSAGAIHRVGQAIGANAFRPGLYLWGACHGTESLAFQRSLRPVMMVRAPLLRRFWIEKGEGVGYGYYFRAERRTLVGTVALGYADGIRRSLSRSKGAPKFRTRSGTKSETNSKTNSESGSDIGFWVDGASVPVIGRVSMDLTLVDLTDHPRREQFENPRTEYWAEWLGPRQDVGKIARAMDVIPYEVFCSLGHRLPRRLIEG